MATLNDLVNELTVEYNFELSEVQQLIDMIRSEGLGIYSIDVDRGELDFSKLEDGTTLEEIRASTQLEIDEDLGEEETYDYFEDFNNFDNPKEGFLYGETFFFVNITEI